MATRNAYYPIFPLSFTQQYQELPNSDNIAKKIIRAIENEDVSAFQNLLRYGADPNSCVDEFGTTPIHVAAGFDSRNIVWMLEKLMQCGGNPNVRNTEQLTPVHVACIENRVDSLRVLLEYGGDPVVRCEDGFTAMGYARKHRAVDCVNFLTELNIFNLEKKCAEEPSYRPPSSSSLQSEYFSCLPTTERVRRVPENSTRSRSHSLVNRKSEDFDPVVSPRLPRRSSLKRSSSGSRNLSRSSSTDKRSTVFSSDSDDDSGLPSANDRFSLQKNPVRSLSEEAVSRSGCRISSISKSGHSSEEAHEPKLRVRWSSGLESEAPSETQERYRDFDKEFASYTSVTDTELRQQLRALGMEPGPIDSSSSRSIYIRKLITLKRTRASEGRNPCEKPVLPFLSELEKVVTGNYDHEEMETLERNFHQAFESNGQVCKRGYFTYLLLDPRISQNLPHQVREGSDTNVLACAKTFLRSIFYIGKGKNSRPMHHLAEAKQFYRTSLTGKVSNKIRRIADIWDSDYGVVSLQCFNGLTENEAYTREHLMMEALGMERLTNDRRSTAYGSVAKWTGYHRRMLGSCFLLKAFGILLDDGERQIFPQNV